MAKPTIDGFLVAARGDDRAEVLVLDRGDFLSAYAVNGFGETVRWDVTRETRFAGREALRRHLKKRHWTVEAERWRS